MLSVKNLKVTYGNIAAISDVSFEVPEGKIVSLIGANGAGKTTTLRAVSGLVAPSGGTVTFKGQDITSTPAHKLVGMGISHVPEGRRIFPVLTVKENLELAAWTLKDKAEVSRRMEEVFEMFPRIKDRIAQLGGTLSGGEQQMLAIGRALMARPKVMLLDEPSMGLAPVIVQEVFRTIRRLKEEGITLLLVEQFAKSALEVADYAYVMEHGRIAVEGTPDELSRNERVIAAYLG